MVNTESKTIFEERLAEFEASKKVLYKNGGSRNELLKELENSFEQVGARWRSRKNFRETTFDGAIRQLLNGGRFTKNLDFDSPLVSRFKKLSEGERTAITSRMETILKKYLEIKSIIFVSDAPLKAIAKNFIAHSTNDGIRFLKLNDNGLPSSKEFSFDELVNSLGIGKFIDSDKSNVGKGIHKATLRETVLKMNPSISQPDAIEAEIKRLALIEEKGIQVPGLPENLNSLYGEFSKESEERAKLELGINGSATLAEINTAKNRTKTYVDSLDDISSIRDEISKIELPKNEVWSLNI